MAHAMTATLPATTSIVHVPAEVYREDLRVEIEAIGDCKHGWFFWH